MTPIGTITFLALGRNWTLRYGNRQRFKIEQEFGKGFAGVFLDTFPGVTADVVASGDVEAIKAAMRPQDIKIASIVIMFQCGILGDISDDEVDAMVEELGYERITELMGEAVSASSPKPEAAQGASTGESKAQGSKIPET